MGLQQKFLARGTFLMDELVPADDDSARRELIGEFGAALRGLRTDAGNPSFRAMAARSGQISHTTLHEAVSGNRLPSWPTTREFVKACGADITQWHERWLEVSKQIQPPEQTDVPSPAFPQRPVLSPAPDAAAPPAAPSRARRWRWIILGTAVTAAATGVLVGEVTNTGGDSAATTQPSQGVRVPGDRSRFIADVTIPDGTRVRVGEHFLKVWQIENAGSVTWNGRSLQRMYLPAAPHSCKTPDRVPIPYSAPGALVDISVPVVAADTPGTCWVGWKMVDDRGQPYFASSRPVYFLVTVTP